MKLKIFRTSNLPLDVYDLQAQKAEWTAGYDKLAEECGSDMHTLQQKCEELANELQKKYNLVGEQEVPKTRKQWAALIEKYQAPILIANSADNPKELVLAIMDQPLA